MGTTPQTEEEIRIDERERIAADIFKKFGEDVPLPSNAPPLKEFSKGVNRERREFRQFARSLRKQNFNLPE